MEPLRAKNKTQGGFTLLEALVAIAILGFGLMAVVSMINVAYLSAERSRNTTRATELAAWMIDRVSFETSSPIQPYTANITRLRSVDNDATASVICDTRIAIDPMNEPGRSICREWRAIIRPAIANASTALPGGYGRVTIIPNDPLWDENHRVTVEVFWQMARSDYGQPLIGLVTERFVRLTTVLGAE